MFSKKGTKRKVREEKQEGVNCLDKKVKLEVDQLRSELAGLERSRRMAKNESAEQHSVREMKIFRLEEKIKEKVTTAITAEVSEQLKKHISSSNICYINLEDSTYVFEIWSYSKEILTTLFNSLLPNKYEMHKSKHHEDVEIVKFKVEYIQQFLKGLELSETKDLLESNRRRARAC